MCRWLLPLLQLFWNHHEFERGRRAGHSPLELADVTDAPSLAEVLGQLQCSSRRALPFLPFTLFHSPTSELPPVGVGLIGAGQFATGTLLPAMKGLRGIRFRGVATSTGLSARHVADKFGFEYCTTDYHEILNDPEIALVFILTRHGSHAHLVAEALRAGKHVFVEKPLALNLEQLRQIAELKREEVEKGKSPFPFFPFPLFHSWL
jgi:hypothetical protein